MGQIRPLYLLFSVLNTVTNIVQNLTLNGKSVDGVPRALIPVHTAEW